MCSWNTDAYSGNKVKLLQKYLSPTFWPRPTPGVCDASEVRATLRWTGSPSLVTVWPPNFKYCTLFISGTELRTDGRTDGRMIQILDAPSGPFMQGHKNQTWPFLPPKYCLNVCPGSRCSFNQSPRFGFPIFLKKSGSAMELKYYNTEGLIGQYTVMTLKTLHLYPFMLKPTIFIHRKWRFILRWCIHVMIFHTYCWERILMLYSFCSTWICKETNALLAAQELCISEEMKTVYPTTCPHSELGRNYLWS